MLKVVAFDWGNTVMYDLDEFQHLGAMVNWPRVAVVPGIEAALAALHGDYRLVIATNAEMSTAAQVKAALARADLDRYFERIWTALELGVAKPDPAYFDILLTELGCLPDEVALVGDTFLTDVEGARRAGLRAVWFNENHTTAPASEFVADAMITSHDQLLTVIRRLSASR